MDEAIIRKIRDAGIVGAGGAGFPTHVKLSAQAEVVVVNGAECEPLLRVDQQLMVEEAEKLVEGLSIAVSVTGAKEGVIALKGKYKEAIAVLTPLIQGKPLSIYVLDDFYPAGDEHLTLYESTGRLVPQGGIPIKVGSVVSNVETLINVAYAMEGIPVTEKYLTLTGQVPNPITVKVPIGIRLREALALAGVKDIAGCGVIDGGPMMGKLVEDLDEPVKKTTKGLIVLPLDHALIRKRMLSIDRISRLAQTACIQCRYCTDLCPRFLLGHHLEPHKIMRALKYMEASEETLRMAFACSECGMCEQYACIMDLSPRTVNAYLKKSLSAKGVKPLDPPENQAPNPRQPDRKVPVKRLIARLGISAYDRKAPLVKESYDFKRAEILLKQHVGAPSVPTVQAGQKVMRGDIVAAIPEKALGVPMHASIDGVVEIVTDGSIIISEGGGRS